MTEQNKQSNLALDKIIAGLKEYMAANPDDSEDLGELVMTFRMLKAAHED